MYAWVLLIGLTTTPADSTTTATYKDDAECRTVAMAINSKATEAIRVSPGSAQVRATCAKIELIEPLFKSPQAGTNKNE